MPVKIRAFCEKTGQAVPADHGQVLRVASESLALKYRVVYDSIRRIQGRDFKRLHTGGGGIQNEMLTRATADALGIEVVAGPVEATSCGNVITQMIGMGHLPDLKSGRDLIRRSFDFKIFEPCDSGVWETAFQCFKKVLEI
jgi:sugar (pentulose or hexulose) kinase